jgi:chaperone BCS1
VFENRRFWAN